MAEGMPMPHSIEEYEAEEALNILVRASEIENDPKMMTAVEEAARRRVAEASRIAESIGVDGALNASKRHVDRDRDGRVNF